MPPHRLTSLALVVIVVACTERAPVPADTSVGGARSVVPALEPARSDATLATRAADPGAALALDGEGLRIIRAPSGATRLVSFGDDRAAVIAIIDRVIGGPPPTLADNLDCPATVATWSGSGLQLWFTADAAARFVGWSLGGPAPTDSTAPRFTTMSGIGLGSTRAALDSVYVATIARSSLGVEFNAGGLAGLLASAQASAPVRNMWAGQVCLAR